jgi:hypothetical protein
MIEEKFVPLRILLKENFKKRGILGLYKGFWVTFNRDVLSYGLYFMSFYIHRDYLIENNVYNSFRIMIAGGISGKIFLYLFSLYDINLHLKIILLNLTSI